MISAKAALRLRRLGWVTLRAFTLKGVISTSMIAWVVLNTVR